MEESFWKKHYQNFSLQEPSNFSQYCVESHLQKNDTLIELGCGNGRDGLLFGKYVDRYVGFDSCNQAVSSFKISIDESTNLNDKNFEIYEKDFTDINFNIFANNCKRIVIYSRFTLHSISYFESDRLFRNISNINVPWVMMLEVRTIFDSLYGKGKKIGEHEYKTDHYRRFIDPDKFLLEICKNFSVQYFELGKKFAPFKGDNPLVLRAVIRAK